MPRAALVEGSLKVLLDEGSSSALFKRWSWFIWSSFRVMGPGVQLLTHRLQVVVENAVVGGGAVSLDLLAFLAHGEKMVWASL